MADTDPCVFCGIIAGTVPAHVVARVKECIIIRPLNPHAPGHVMVIPELHVRDFASDPFTAGRASEVASYHAREHLRGPCNIITSIGEEATQSVLHLHIHIIPRGPSDRLPKRWPWIRSRRAEPCGCGWCCNNVPPGQAGEAHLRVCAAQKRPR